MLTQLVPPALAQQPSHSPSCGPLLQETAEQSQATTASQRTHAAVLDRGDDGRQAAEQLCLGCGHARTRTLVRRLAKLELRLGPPYKQLSPQLQLDARASGSRRSRKDQLV